jgi:Domain of unknown function (DUF929)
MPQEQKKPSTGGNKPKPPPAPPKGNQSASAKERSKAQSRSVSTKSPSGRPATASDGRGGGKGGNTPRPGARPAPAAPSRRFSGTMIAWLSVGLVVLIIAVVVIVSQLGGTSNTSYTPVTAAPASVVNAVTNIPASVYNSVGINSQVRVVPPTILKNQPPMTLSGKSPAMLYYGAEYCPFCAAERWPMTAALSRFGSWSGLKVTASSHTDTDAQTHTFSYRGATLTSPYITFQSVEQYSTTPLTGTQGYQVLENPTSEQKANLTKYSSSQFNPNATTQGGISFPFVNINNLALISGASYDPGVLAGLSWSDIAGGLTDPSNPATQAIVATANYISAAICASSSNAPSSVCKSSGVMAASKALKLS